MRIRTIKPEFWRSEDVTALPMDMRLLFIGLWSYVDDNGVGIDDERLIAADLFALEDDPTAIREFIREGLATLSRGLQIVRYQVDGKRLLFITNWDKHQKIDKPNKPRLPRPDTIPTRPNGNPEPEFPTPSRDRRETPAPGTGEQRNRGTENPSPTTDVTPPRASARDRAAALNADATSHTAHQLVHRWHTEHGHAYTRTDLANLVKAVDALLADGAHPQHIPTTLDIQHHEGHSLAFIPHAYREATKRTGQAVDAHSRGPARVGPRRPSTTDTRLAEIQALKAGPAPGLRVIEGAAS
ncbi:hypothetical protein [Amycolatopsis thermoflava]|uniref:hypothetical protein n=1 Tax=Amycolatopsis thermoflava TaxID=84480 RepID=UPI0037F3C525